MYGPTRGKLTEHNDFCFYILKISMMRKIFVCGLSKSITRVRNLQLSHREGLLRPHRLDGVYCHGHDLRQCKRPKPWAKDSQWKQVGKTLDLPCTILRHSFQQSYNQARRIGNASTRFFATSKKWKIIQKSTCEPINIFVHSSVFIC
jgi:hypothetical protein